MAGLVDFKLNGAVNTGSDIDDKLNGLIDALPQAIFEAIYPIGCIYTSTVATNPNTVFGFGTWAAFGAGKVPVGYNVSDSDFNEAEKTGGAKTVNLAHTHSVPRDGWGYASTNVAGRLHALNAGATDVCAANDNTSGSGGSATQSVVQPYIVVYMWKRTA